ncbi:peroxisomal fatty acid beta-oxidation multifunctional protein [Spatholobus suberectus]|nr:peroxisomal fatty acid beta-oxidation multifunctional protein [Spatholobus suberectus]
MHVLDVSVELVVNLIADLKKPVVVAVQRLALGSGLELAMFHFCPLSRLTSALIRGKLSNHNAWMGLIRGKLPNQFWINCYKVAYNMELFCRFLFHEEGY